MAKLTINVQGKTFTFTGSYIDLNHMMTELAQTHPDMVFDLKEGK